AAVCFICYPLIFNQETISLRNGYLELHNTSLSNYLFHYLLVVLIAFMLYALYRNEKSIKSTSGLVTLQWFSAFIILYVASAELDHLMVMSQYSKEKSVISILNNN